MHLQIQMQAMCVRLRVRLLPHPPRCWLVHALSLHIHSSQSLMAHSHSPQDWYSYHFRLLDLNLYAVSFLRALDLFPFQIFFNLLNQPILIHSNP